MAKELVYTITIKDKDLKTVTTLAAGLKNELANSGAEADTLTANFAKVAKGLDIVNGKIRETNAALAKASSAKIGENDYQKQAAEIAKLTAEIAQLTAAKNKLSAAEKDLKTAANYQITSNKNLLAINQLSSAYKGLDAAEDTAAKGNPLKEKIDGITASSKKLENEISDLNGKVGEAISNTTSFTGLVGATVTGLQFDSAIDSLKDGVEQVAELANQFVILQGTTQKLSKLSGKDLEDYTVRLLAISNVFDEDYNEVLRASNTLVKQLGITTDEATDFIEQGFLSSANAGNNFLDSVSEYSTFVESSKLSTEQFLKILNSSQESGVFSDKLIDSLKEATIRLREMPKATKEALAKVGLDQKAIREQIENEGIGAAISTIAQKLAKLKEDSPEAASLLSTVFGSAGEDAGIKAIVAGFANINDGTIAVTTSTNAYVVAQKNALEKEKEFVTAQAALAAELGNIKSTYAETGKILATQFIKGLVIFAQVLKEIPKFLRENKAELYGLGVALVGLNTNNILAAASTLYYNGVQKAAAIATNAQVLAQTALNLAMRANPIGLLITGVGLLVVGLSQAYKRSEDVRATFAGLAALGAEFIAVIKESFGTFLLAVQNVKDGNYKDALLKVGEAIVKNNPIAIAITQGARLSQAYTNGYNSLKVNEIEKETKQKLETVAENLGEVAPIFEAEGKKLGDSLGSGIKKSTGAESLSTLQSKLQDLNTELQAASTKNEIANAIRKIITTESDIERLTEKIERVKREIANVGSSQTIEVLPTSSSDITDTFTAIRAELIATSATGKDLAEDLEKTLADALINGNEDIAEANRADISTRKAEIQDFSKFKENADLSAADKAIAAKKQENEAIIELEKQQIAERKKNLAEITEAVKGAGFDLVKGLANNYLSNQRDQAAEEQKLEIDNLNEKYKTRLEAAEGNAAETARITEQLEAEKAAIEKRAAERRKKIAIKEILISGAVAAVKALPNFFAVAAVAIATAANLALAANTQFREGGILNFRKGGVAKGNRHEDGGIRTYSGNGAATGLEIEGGEAVLTRKASIGKSKDLASFLNVLAGGKAFGKPLQPDHQQVITSILHERPIKPNTITNIHTPQIVKPVAYVGNGNVGLVNAINTQGNSNTVAIKDLTKKMNEKIDYLIAENKNLMEDAARLKNRYSRQEKRSKI